MSANGKFGLRFTRGGFGTPFFGEDARLRLEGGELVVTEGGEERRGPIESLAGCGRLAGAGLEHSRVQLWPEHFDMAVKLGSEEAGERAGYGCSPGDEEHPEPYVYVTPWTARPEGELWNATAFPGAELAYAALLGAGDQREAALEFFRARRRELTAA